MKIAVPAEEVPGEKRIAVSPDTVKAYRRKGIEVVIETGAGRGSSLTDAQFAEAGATIAPDAREALRGADVVLTVRRPPAGRLNGVKPGAVVLGQMDPYGD